MKRIAFISVSFLGLTIGAWWGIGVYVNSTLKDLSKQQDGDVTFEMVSSSPWRHQATLRHITFRNGLALEGDVQVKYRLFRNAFEVTQAQRATYKTYVITFAPTSSLTAILNRVTNFKTANVLDLFDSVKLRLKNVTVANNEAVFLNARTLMINTTYLLKESTLNLHFEAFYKELQPFGLEKINGTYIGKMRFNKDEIEKILSNQPTSLSFFELGLRGHEETPWANNQRVLNLAFRNVNGQKNIRFNGKSDIDFREQWRLDWNVIAEHLPRLTPYKEALHEIGNWWKGLTDIGRLTVEFDTDIIPKFLPDYSGIRRLNFKIAQKDFLWEFKGALDKGELKGNSLLFFTDMPAFVDKSADLAFLISRHFFPDYSSMVQPEAATLKEILKEVVKPPKTGPYKDFLNITFSGNASERKQIVFINEVALEGLAVKYVLTREKYYKEREAATPPPQ